MRFLAGTHKDLLSEVRKGNFREDLFFRLNVIPIKVPPLRERPEDVVPLAEFFIRKFCRLNSLKIKTLSREGMSYLMQNPWKGNVRELENAIERAVVLSQRDSIEYDDFLPTVDAHGLAPVENGSYEDPEALTEFPSEVYGSDHTREMMTPLSPATLGSAMPAMMSSELEFGSMIGENGDVLTLNELSKRYVKWALDRNGGAKEMTAKMLGIDRKTLYRKIQELDS